MSWGTVVIVMVIWVVVALVVWALVHGGTQGDDDGF